MEKVHYFYDRKTPHVFISHDDKKYEEMYTNGPIGHIVDYIRTAIEDKSHPITMTNSVPEKLKKVKGKYRGASKLEMTLLQNLLRESGITVNWIV